MFLITSSCVEEKLTKSWHYKYGFDRFVYLEITGKSLNLSLQDLHQLINSLSGNINFIEKQTKCE